MADFLHLILEKTSYNTLIVMMSTLCLGMSSGVLGSFLILRKKALVSDALSHSTLPGLALAFLLLPSSWFLHYKLPLLLGGALVTCLIAVGLIQYLEKSTKLDSNTIIGVILSSFFGVGLVLLSFIQHMPNSEQGGLTHFIFGQAASMRQIEAISIMIIAFLCLSLSALFFRSFQMICFDRLFTKSIGYSFEKLDLFLIFLITITMMTGLQSVGMLLIVSLLIIPGATARLWFHTLKPIVYLASFLGGFACIIGTLLSATFNNLPTGATIVLILSCFFFISYLLKPKIINLQNEETSNDLT